MENPPLTTSSTDCHSCASYPNILSCRLRTTRIINLWPISNIRPELIITMSFYNRNFFSIDGKTSTACPNTKSKKANIQAISNAGRVEGPKTASKITENIWDYAVNCSVWHVRLHNTINYNRTRYVYSL